ncbi:hypothetical protein PUN28_003138 [Cardiocondyla obscurior]|uniref:C3H1-type domain-containing protein n=1 Tax=Cardiocondyla obscurior TaxID=286306 RepID=A0AAW2GK81_9HYME
MALSKSCTRFLARNTCKQSCKQLHVQPPVATPSTSRVQTRIHVDHRRRQSRRKFRERAISSFYCLIYERQKDSEVRQVSERISPNFDDTSNAGIKLERFIFRLPKKRV